MKKIIPTILLFLTLISCSINKKLKTGGDWNGYDYLHFCPSYTFSEKAQKSKKLDILNTNDISMAEKGYLSALEKAKKYIRKRGGENFFDKVQFYDVDIIYLDSINDFKSKGQTIDLNKCSNTKYYFRFLFKNGRNINYRFGIALTKNEEIISKKRFPEYNSNPDFSNVIKPKKALRLAKKYDGSLIYPIGNIELNYDDKNNCFVWEIEQKIKSNKKSNKAKYGYIKMNAESGKILKSKILETIITDQNTRYW